MGNFLHLDNLLPDPYRDLSTLVAGLPVADIGGADGDVAFTLEMAIGTEVDIIDTAHSNMNALQGPRLTAQQLGSDVKVYDIDLDRQFALPRERYGLVMLLGILYHLQNPYFVLRELAEHARFCVVSTRVTRLAGANSTDISDLPVAYLVSATEMNNDATNYWIFTNTGLDRLVARAGWHIRARLNAGDVQASRPDSPAHDERVFLLLESAAAV
jgi:hypothetical protein